MIEQIFGDLGFRNVLTWNFFLCLIILLIMMWIRIYSHYLGSWIFLKLAEVPITTYDLKLYKIYIYIYIYRFTVDLDYPMTRVGFEIGVILCGNIFNILIFNCVMFLAWLFQKLKIGLAGIFYKIISSFGIAVLADFFLILVIDCAIQVYIYIYILYINIFKSRIGMVNSLNCIISLTVPMGQGSSGYLLFYLFILDYLWLIHSAYIITWSSCIWMVI